MIEKFDCVLFSRKNTIFKIRIMVQLQLLLLLLLVLVVPESNAKGLFGVSSGNRSSNSSNHGSSSHIGGTFSKLFNLFMKTKKESLKLSSNNHHKDNHNNNDDDGNDDDDDDNHDKTLNDNTNDDTITTTSNTIHTTAMEDSTKQHFSVEESNELREEILNMISHNPTGYKDGNFRDSISNKIQDYATNSPPESIDPNDIIFVIGAQVYGAKTEFPHHDVDGTLNKKPVIIHFDYMKEFIKDVFVSYGVTQERAELCSDVLIESDRRGIDSHGLGRLKPIYCDRIDQGILYVNAPITIVKETETTALVDGNLGIGLYIGPYCMQMAIDKAKKYGVGFVAVQNSTHYGIAGYYTTMASQQGCVGFSGTNARPSIAPTFGTEPMLGTNPLCFAMPSDEEFDFCIDCATSVNQRGKIERYAREGLATPAGAVIDNDGIERTDTEGILRDMVLGKCALTPVGGAGEKMGGYKGYGWATVVELLSTAFQSGPFGEAICGIDRETGKPIPMPLGHFFLAINIEALCPLETFKENVGNLLRALRASRKSPLGPGRIWTAGEREYDARQERYAQGGMVVPISLQKNMISIRDARPDLQEKYSKFPFE